MVCTEEDDFTREKVISEARWVAKLTNGQTVIQDDNRPGVEPSSAWLRLGEYVRELGLGIVGLEIRFRSHVERPVPDCAEGYFFRSGVIGFLNDKVTRGFFLVGHLQKSQILVQRWSVPELVQVESEVRDPADHELVGPSLIVNPPM